MSSSVEYMGGEGAGLVQDVAVQLNASVEVKVLFSKFQMSHRDLFGRLRKYDEYCRVVRPEGDAGIRDASGRVLKTQGIPIKESKEGSSSEEDEEDDEDEDESEEVRDEEFFIPLPKHPPDHSRRRLT